MANLLLPIERAHSVRPSTPPDGPASSAARRSGVVLVASFGDPVAADYAAAVGQSSLVELWQAEAIERLRATFHAEPFADIVLFLPPRLGRKNALALARFLTLATEHGARFFGIVSSFRVHFGDRAALETEGHALQQLKRVPARVVVFRPGHVLSEHSATTVNLRRFSFLAPLTPGRLRSCCLEGHEFFAAIERARLHSRQRRTLTLLGPNRPWKERLREQQSGGALPTCLRLVSRLIALFLVGQFAALLIGLLARWRPRWRRWHFDTLRPRSIQELLTLCHPHNFQHVRVVGYNNGVNHFGHRYPGKTVVSTVFCQQIHRSGPNEIKADCGATIRKAMDFLASDGQELLVIPNFSYVCLGTAFFVPIHGSASDCATVAETITRALLYDPINDRFIHAAHDEAAFCDHVYNVQSPVLLLRLWLRVKRKARYFVKRQAFENPSPDALLQALRDTQADNVEIRKSKAASARVDISKYYRDDPSCASGRTDALEVPRDSLGRLWDWLEENALTSFLMHALTRHLAWHVELFFGAEEFKTFWATHGALPLKKIQLRYIRRDGLPHSPFRDHDCVSVDMFLWRRSRRRFEAYLKQTFGAVRSNPGKHSQ